MVQPGIGKRTMLASSLAMLVVGSLASQQAQAQPTQLDETWTVTVNGQSVPVNPNGSFFIPNISAADQFGAGGPRTPPDFLSDDFLTLTAVGDWMGTTYYAYTPVPFQIADGETFSVDNLLFTAIPPPMPESILITANQTVLEIGGDPAVLMVLAEIPGQPTQDVTLPDSWTVYRSSNPNIATVDFIPMPTPMMVVSAQAVGVAFREVFTDSVHVDTLNDHF